MDFKKIEKQLIIASAEYDNALNNLDIEKFSSFLDFDQALEPFLENVSKLSVQYRLHKPIGELKDIPKYGDVMTLEDFVEICQDGGFIDYDGYGKYCTEDKMTDITIIPSDVMSGNYRKDFKKIIWFNK